MSPHLGPAMLVIALALGASACADATDTEPTASAVTTAPNGDVHNQADVDFATRMIPHHAGALLMVDMTNGRDLSPEFAELVEGIRDAQAPEIEQMTDWLTAWREPVPETARDHANSHGADANAMGGMGMGMDPDDLERLEQMSGSGFEEAWMQLMIVHHEDAIDMAEVEVDDGRFDGAIALAEDIRDAQTAEIARMEEMIGSSSAD